jgi:hypothetical protein
MTDIETMAEGLIDELAEMFSVEESLRRIPQGLEWGRPGGRQRLWWGDLQKGNESAPDLIRVRILTEMAGLPSDPGEWPPELCEEMVEALDLTLWGGLLPAEEMDGCLCIGAAITVHPETIGTMPRMLFMAMVSHAEFREILWRSELRHQFAQYPGAETAGDMTELGAALEHLLLGAGQIDHEGIEEDMGLLQGILQNYPCLLCNGDEKELVADFPFGDETSQLRIMTEDEHSLFGPSLSMTLLLPISGSGTAESLIKSAMTRNSLEQNTHEVPSCMGSWSVSTDCEAFLSYVVWVPHAMFAPRILFNMGLALAARARYCCETITGMSIQESYPLGQQEIIRRIEKFMEDAQGNKQLDTN